MVIFHSYVSLPEGKLRFIAGTIIEVDGIFLIAMFDYHRVM
jgi:hypothetical protein